MAQSMPGFCNTPAGEYTSSKTLDPMWGGRDMNESVLPPGVAEVADHLAHIPAVRAFYLAGGTAYALQRGHRRSKDLDFFTQAPSQTLPRIPSMSTLHQRFSSVEILERTADQIHYQLDQVYVTFLAYPFSHHFPFLNWRNLQIADLRDIVIQKAYTIGRRPRARDYIDLHDALTHPVLNLDEIVIAAKKLYGEQFSPRLFLQQLTYTQDLEDIEQAVGALTTSKSFDDISRDLQNVVRIYVQRVLASSKPPSLPKPGGPRL